MYWINLEQVLTGATIAFMGWQYYGNINWVLVGSVIVIMGLLFGPHSGSANRPFRAAVGVEDHSRPLACAGRRIAVT